MRNSVRIYPTHVEIVLDRIVGREPLLTVVDYEDYEILRKLDLRWQARWSASANTHYVQARLSYSPSKFIQLHRLLTGIQDQDWKMVVPDHLDHDGLNNRRSNLIVRSKADNHVNLRGPTSRNTSGYRGVTWDKRRNLWQAQHQITLNGKRKCHFLGYFSDPSIASTAVSEFIKNRIP